MFYEDGKVCSESKLIDLMLFFNAIIYCLREFCRFCVTLWLKLFVLRTPQETLSHTRKRENEGNVPNLPVYAMKSPRWNKITYLITSLKLYHITQFWYKCSVVFLKHNSDALRFCNPMLPSVKHYSSVIQCYIQRNITIMLSNVIYSELVIGYITHQLQ